MPAAPNNHDAERIHERLPRRLKELQEAFWAANTASLVKVETSMPCQIPYHLSLPKRHGTVTA
jgi:hypothetical protein